MYDKPDNCREIIKNFGRIFPKFFISVCQRILFFIFDTLKRLSKMFPNLSKRSRRRDNGSPAKQSFVGEKEKAMDIADFLRLAEWSGFHCFRRTVESVLADSRNFQSKSASLCGFFPYKETSRKSRFSFLLLYCKTSMNLLALFIFCGRGLF